MLLFDLSDKYLYFHMEITNTIFETLLTKNNFMKKDFAQYSKIPYDTVVGWKKKGYVPPYAIVILKDMIIIPQEI